VPIGYTAAMSIMTQSCEYELCNCSVTGGTEGAAYCSDTCRERDSSDEEMETACECGHSPCDEA
jgi:hypothetical protein